MDEETQEHEEREQEVHQEINHEIQEHEGLEQEVPPEIVNDEIQEQQEVGQQVRSGINHDIQEEEEQMQRVPPEINNEIQEQQEQNQKEVPPAINEEIQEQEEQGKQVPRQINEIQEQQEQEEEDQFPPKLVYHAETKAEFHLTELIGTSYHGKTTVHRATYLLRDIKERYKMPFDSFFAVKVVKAVRESEDYNNLFQRADNSRLFLKRRDPNIIGIENIFTDNGIFCVVFPCKDGSLQSLMRARFPDGIPQEYIIVILKEALKGLCFLHDNHLVHGEISAGQIFYTRPHYIQLSFAATVYDHGTDQNDDDPDHLPLKHISKWASAPEVYLRSDRLNNTKTDIWMIGITALQLACGEVKIQNRDHIMSIVNKIKKEQRLSPLRGKQSTSPRKQFVALFDRFKGKSTKSFEKFVCKCLADDPAKRPTARQLLNSEPFTMMRKDVKDLCDILE